LNIAENDAMTDMTLFSPVPPYKRRKKGKKGIKRQRRAKKDLSLDRLDKKSVISVILNLGNAS